MTSLISGYPKSKSYKDFTQWALERGAHYVEPTTLGQRGFGQTRISAIAVDQCAGETLAVWVKGKGLVYKSPRLPLPKNYFSSPIHTVFGPTQE